MYIYTFLPSYDGGFILSPTLVPSWYPMLHSRTASRTCPGTRERTFGLQRPSLKRRHDTHVRYGLHYAATSFQQMRKPIQQSFSKDSPCIALLTLFSALQVIYLFYMLHLRAITCGRCRPYLTCVSQTGSWTGSRRCT